MNVTIKIIKYFLIISFVTVKGNNNCYQSVLIRGNFTYKEISIKEIIVPSILDKCTQDLFIFFYMPESNIRKFGYLNKDFRIEDKDEEIDCMEKLTILLKIDRYKISRILNVIIVEDLMTDLPLVTSTISSVTSALSTTIQTKAHLTLSTTTTNTQFELKANIDSKYEKLKSEETLYNDSFDLNFSFKKFINDINDLILIFSNVLSYSFCFRKQIYKKFKQIINCFSNDHLYSTKIEAISSIEKSVNKLDGNSNQTHVMSSNKTDGNLDKNEGNSNNTKILDSNDNQMPINNLTIVVHTNDKIVENSEISCQCRIGSCNNCKCYQNKQKCSQKCHKGQNTSCKNK